MILLVVLILLILLHTPQVTESFAKAMPQKAMKADGSEWVHNIHETYTADSLKDAWRFFKKVHTKLTNKASGRINIFLEVKLKGDVVARVDKKGSKDEILYTIEKTMRRIDERDHINNKSEDKAVMSTDSEDSSDDEMSEQQRKVSVEVSNTSPDTEKKKVLEDSFNKLIAQAIMRSGIGQEVHDDINMDFTRCDKAFGKIYLNMYFKYSKGHSNKPPPNFSKLTPCKASKGPFKMFSAKKTITASDEKNIQDDLYEAISKTNMGKNEKIPKLLIDYLNKEKLTELVYELERSPFHIKLQNGKTVITEPMAIFIIQDYHTKSKSFNVLMKKVMKISNNDDRNRMKKFNKETGVVEKTVSSPSGQNLANLAGDLNAMINAKIHNEVKKHTLWCADGTTCKLPHGMQWNDMASKIK